MGSVFTHTGTPTISVTVTDPDGELTSSIKLYYGVPGSGTAATVLTSNTSSNTLTYTHSIANLAQYYYYLEITQTDGNKIWTSPIWYKRNDAASSVPVANFTTLTTTVCAGSPVVFNDASTNSPTAWSWSFPGATPGTSTAHTPTVTYSAPGTYNVTLTASNPSGTNTYTHTAYITVNPGIPTPTISQAGNVLTSSATSGNQWYWNGTLILGATNQSFTYSLNGSYTVVVSSGGCTSAMSAPLVATATGILEMQNLNAFNVYPNPNDGNFNVTFTAASKASYTISISNALGQLIYKDVIADFTGTYTKQLSVSEYGKGVYTVSLTNEKNETVKKIIVY
jgi:PKD repeat protein